MNLINVYIYWKERYKEDRAWLFLVPSDEARGNEHIVECKRFCLNIRKHFTMG